MLGSTLLNRLSTKLSVEDIRPESQYHTSTAQVPLIRGRPTAGASKGSSRNNPPQTNGERLQMRRRVAIFKGNPNRWTHLTARPTCSKEHWQSIGLNDTQADMLPGVPESAICVQRFDDSLNSAIHITYRSWLRSSSMHEPRDPPLKVVIKLLCLTDQHAATAHQPDQTTNVHSVRTDLVHTGFFNWLKQRGGCGLPLSVPDPSVI